MKPTGIAGSIALAAMVLLSGCAVGDDVKILPPEAVEIDEPSLEFDGSLEPAAAVLPLVPEDTARLTVTDFEHVRLQLGQQSLTTEDERQDRDAFWERARAETPMLSTGTLRLNEEQLERKFGLSQMDVAWEAHFADAADSETGFVLAFRDGTDMGAVERAQEAGYQPLQGATVDRERGLVTSGTASDLSLIHI